MTRRPPALIAATLASAVALAACGGSSSGLIPTTDAHTLSSDLTVLSSGLGAHNCSEVSSALSAVDTDIFNLPSSVDTRLRNNLVKGYENLDNHARTQCQPKTRPHHPPTHATGPTGTTHATGPTETTTGPTGPTETTGPTGPTSTGGTTGSSGTVGSGGGVQAPGSTGATGDTSGGTAGAGL